MLRLPSGDIDTCRMGWQQFRLPPPEASPRRKAGVQASAARADEGLVCRRHYLKVPRSGEVGPGLPPGRQQGVCQMSVSVWILAQPLPLNPTPEGEGSSNCHGPVARLLQCSMVTAVRNRGEAWLATHSTTIYW